MEDGAEIKTLAIGASFNLKAGMYLAILSRNHFKASYHAGVQYVVREALNFHL